MTGKEFRKWRRNNDITQLKVAEMCGVDESTISRWENDKIVLNMKTYETIIDFMEYTENKKN